MWYIIGILTPRLTHSTNRSCSIPVHLQVLIALEFYATGCFQITVGDVIHVDQSTVSRVIKAVSISIAEKRRQFIKFPQSDREIMDAMESFHATANFSHVVGAIDGTHVKISNPGGEDALRFINRKGWFSINCQATCSADMLITNIVAHWPASTHDARIFAESRIKNMFDDGHCKGILVGDAGYPCLPFLMTPVARPLTQNQRRYNRAHILTRNVIERVFGVLKRRFSCLYFGLRLKMETSLCVIITCCVLHNIAIMHREADDFQNIDDGDNDDVLPPEMLPPVNQHGNLVRQRIVQQFGNN